MRPAIGVLTDVPQDVGQLHGEAEVDGVLAGALILVPHYLNTDQPHDGRDTVAVRGQVFKGLVARDG